MNEQITKRANELMNCEEYGHELTWEKAVRFATEEAEEKAAEQAERTRKVAPWNEYKASLRAAGCSDQAIKALSPSSPTAFFDLPLHISTGRIGFATPEREAAVKAAIRTLWLAIGYGEPDFAPFDFAAERNKKHTPWLQCAG